MCDGQAFQPCGATVNGAIVWDPEGGSGKWGLEKYLKLNLKIKYKFST